MTLWNDILANPSNFEQVVDTHLSHDLASMEKAAGLIRQVGRTVFTGIGSGLNATIPASYYLMSRSFPSQYLDTTEAAYQLYSGIKDSALILNTRSGETAEVVRLASQAHRDGLTTIAVTNEPGSTVGRLVDVCLPTRSRWDTLVVISAYLGMAASELMLAAMVTQTFDVMASELQRAASLYGQVLDQVIAQRQELLEAVQDAHTLYLLGRGSSLASVHSGALVIQETSRRDVVPLATGLFRQGPIEVVDHTFRAIVFEGCGETAALSYRLAQELLQQGGRIIWVGGTHLPGAVNVPMPDFSEHILPLFEILPTQVLAHDLAVHDGITPGEVRHIQAVITTEHGIQSQSSSLGNRSE